MGKVMVGLFVFMFWAFSTKRKPPMKPQDSALINDPGFQNGLTTRTQVMGEPFVERAFTNATDYTLPMQEFITRNAWGNVWQRPGLDLKTRSLITVAMLAALGKQTELKGHVRGALNNGVTPEELREVMLHATVYYGFPAAIDAFRSVTEVVEGLVAK
jgi:4-carboxymuconolactone decarboxylase